MYNVHFVKSSDAAKTAWLKLTWNPKHKWLSDAGTEQEYDSELLWLHLYESEIVFPHWWRPRYVISVMCFYRRLIFSNSEAADFLFQWLSIFSSTIDWLVRLCIRDVLPLFPLTQTPGYTHIPHTHTHLALWLLWTMSLEGPGMSQFVCSEEMCVRRWTIFIHTMTDDRGEAFLWKICLQPHLRYTTLFMRRNVIFEVCWCFLDFHLIEIHHVL